MNIEHDHTYKTKTDLISVMHWKISDKNSCTYTDNIKLISMRDRENKKYKQFDNF